MSEPRRRSTRLVGTPKVNYEEKSIELFTRPSSLKKRRDSPDGSGKFDNEENKRFKKAKLKHDDDDEDTILDDFKPANERNSTNSEKKKKPNSKANCDETEDEDATDLDDETVDSEQQELKENHSQNTTNDHSANRQEASSDCLVREKTAVQCDPSNGVDEHGFLIQDFDETDNAPSSPPVNQNILDVTDYDRFDDESTLIDQIPNDDQGDRTASNDVNRDAAIDERQPRKKKFVKKYKPRRCSIELGNLIKHSSGTLDSQATIIINQASDERDDEPENLSKEQPSMKTSFIDFFASQNISKSSPVEQQSDEVQVIQPVKRGRGRPRKNPPAQANATTPQSTVSSAPIKQLPEVLIEIDCEMVETVSKSSISKRDALLDDTIIVLDKREDDASSAARADDPWTIKYRPLRADQVLDNQLASEKIKNWIHDFSKNVEISRLYDSDDEEEEERFETCVLVTGPTGCGKTAMVYAIAEELNYKVFEINCSSRRNSRFINQIKEATLSHTVRRQNDSSSSNLFNSNSNSKGTSKVSGKNPPPPVDSKQKTLFSFFQKKPAAAAVQAPLIDESSFSQETVNNLKALSINSNSL